MYYLERVGLGGGSQTDNTSSQEGRLWKISFEGSGAPFISIQPKSVLSPVGEDVSFALRAIGQDMSYTWFKDDVMITNNNTDELILSDVQLSDNDSEYYCLISNSIGMVSSDTIVLNVTSNYETCSTNR